ncbi:MAG: DUF3822 family protein [Polaribacter sp.]|nr:DUF3822 family protein [Polaribacter sp.]
MTEKTVLKNKETSLKEVKDNILSIQFSLDGFSFCTSNSTEKLLFKNYSFNQSLNSPEALLQEIKTIFNSEPDLQTEFSKIEVIHKNNLFAIVPDAYFNKESISQYLKYNIKTLKTDFITFDDIKEIGAKNSYIPYVNINNYLFQNFGEFQYQHHISVLLKKLVSIHTYEKKIMYVNVDKSNFDIIILDDKKLIFANSFSYISKEDFIYYILFVAEQNNLNPEEFKLQLLGNISIEDETYKIAYKYIKYITFLESRNVIYTRLKIQNHTNYTLLG